MRRLSGCHDVNIQHPVTNWPNGHAWWGIGAAWWAVVGHRGPSEVPRMGQLVSLSAPLEMALLTWHQHEVQMPQLLQMHFKNKRVYVYGLCGWLRLKT